jgi:hypothetical protein
MGDPDRYHTEVLAFTNSLPHQVAAHGTARVHFGASVDRFSATVASSREMLIAGFTGGLSAGNVRGTRWSRP